MSRDRFQSDESGVAMITAILAVFTLLGLSVMFVAMTQTENEVTGNARAFEAAIHSAEGATDGVIARINRSDEGNYTSPGITYLKNADGSTFDCGTNDPSTAEGRERCESQWMISLGKSAPDSEIIKTDAGESYAVRPVDSSGLPMDLILGVGFVPVRGDDEAATRVVRLQFDQRSYTPRHAILACGNMAMGGNASITDLSGNDSADVHSNGNVTASGSGGSVSVEGSISATGTVGLTGTSASGGVHSGAIEEDCPPITARDFYSRNDEVITPHPWWDLCPDGIARRPSASGDPCTNDTADNHNVTTDGPHLGWSFDPDRKVWSTNAVQDGVFYLYRGTAKIGGIDRSGGASHRNVTIIAEADPASTTGTSGSSCQAGSVNTGNICLSGAPKLIAALRETLLIADRDVSLSGSAASGGSDLSGFVFAREQAEVSGTVTLRGAMIAADDPHTPRSPIGETRVTGTMNLQFTPGMEIPLTGIVRVTHWNELRR